MQKGVLFDLDGTIVDSSHDLAVAINAMRSYFDYPPLPIAQVVGFIGNGTISLVTQSIADTSIDLHQALVVNHEKYSQALSVYSTIYPGMIEVLKFLKYQDIPVAIVSNKTTAWCESIALDLGFSTYISAIYGDDPAYALKPEPDMLRLVAHDLGIDLTQSLMVGDNWTDVDVGLKVGCQTAFFELGLGGLREQQPQFKYRTSSELKSWLELHLCQ
jgi:HAD superfamily hydrolase (TIGR01662 family)